MKHFWIPETWMWMWPDGWAARHCMSRTEHQNLAIDYWFVVWCQTLVLLVQSVFLFCWNKSSVHVWCRVSSLKWIRTPEPGGLKLFQSEAEADGCSAAVLIQTRRVKHFETVCLFDPVLLVVTSSAVPQIFIQTNGCFGVSEELKRL